MRHRIVAVLLLVLISAITACSSSAVEPSPSTPSNEAPPSFALAQLTLTCELPRKAVVRLTGTLPPGVASATVHLRVDGETRSAVASTGEWTLEWKTAAESKDQVTLTV